MSNGSGYFEAYVNSRAFRPGEAEKLLMAQMTSVAVRVLPGARIHWAGSQRKGTAIDTSDLDMCLESNTPVTEAQRRQLRTELEQSLRRPAQILSHVIRLPASGKAKKVDLAFSNASFGSRPLPDVAVFGNRPARQQAARALKLWTRRSGMPRVAGWAIEALVLHLDQPPRQSGLELFERILDWFSNSATPQAIEGVLRGAASPAWKADWSKGIPGTLQALQGQAKAMAKRPGPASWKNSHEVGTWLGQ